MALNIGIVGLPNVGKSTLFNALAKAQIAQCANYPFCTIEPNKATVAVPDKRLDTLSAMVQPQKTTPAVVDFVDIAGLVRGASVGEGLGNQFLANIRTSSAILEVVRCFEDDNITHVDGDLNPVRDIETIETEMLLADIQSVEKRLERIKKMGKGNRDAQGAIDETASLLAHLNNGQPASSFAGGDLSSSGLVHELNLLTAKPVIYCANIDDVSLIDKNQNLLELQNYVQKRQASLVTICAKLEEEMSCLSDDEQAELHESYGIQQSGLESIIQTGYKTLGLASYFTVGPKEARAWTFADGWKAPACAGVIHSDFEKGFIRAEVISYEDYLQYGSASACRTAGCLRTEGKEYVVKDGDIIEFLFNV